MIKKVSPNEKALQYIDAGRVSVTEVSEHYALVLVASSRGPGDPYRVEYDDGAWTCDCPARVLQCVHVTAAKKVVHPIPLEGGAADAAMDAEEEARTNWLDDLLDG